MKLVCTLMLAFSLQETICSFSLTRFWWFHLWHTEAIPCSRVLYRALALCLSLRSPLAFSDTSPPTLPKTVMWKHLCSELHLGLCIFSCFRKKKSPCVYIFIFPIVVMQLQVELSYLSLFCSYTTLLQPFGWKQSMGVRCFCSSVVSCFPDPCL